MKAQVVWIKKREYEDGIEVEMEEVYWEVEFREPGWNIDLYDKFVLIPLED